MVSQCAYACGCGCAQVCLCLRARVCVCLRVCLRVCCARVCALYVCVLCAYASLCACACACVTLCVCVRVHKHLQPVCVSISSLQPALGHWQGFETILRAHSVTVYIRHVPETGVPSSSRQGGRMKIHTVFRSPEPIMLTRNEPQYNQRRPAFETW